ncbi:type II secretion system F family protein [Undibacterium sp. TJN19]|uniref:type II secretion system F family protein n=1 Tax=Undibacterium sp. TJN19 TaxID=3413055 RepID=UPI003BF16FE2
MKNTPHLPLPFGVRADLLHQLAALSKAGIAPLRALALIKLPGGYQTRMLATLRGVTRGQNLAQAGQESGLWTPLEAGLLQAALAAGDPTSTYRRLAEHYQVKAQQLASIKSRMALPIFTGLLSLFVTPLPQLIGGTLTMAAYLWSVLRPVLLCAILFTGGVYAMRRLQMRPINARVSAIDSILLALPVFGKMHKQRNFCDFWQSIALLLEAGLPMFEAVPLALHGVNNVLLRRDLAQILPRMQKGATLADALRALPKINNSALLGMVQTGEASGSLPEMLDHYAKGENASLALQQKQVAEWIPRIAYGMIAAVIAYGILKSGAFNPHVPEDL